MSLLERCPLRPGASEPTAGCLRETLSGRHATIARVPDDVVTLLAVVIGGLLTYVVQWRLDERRGERERERDDAAVARERAREETGARVEFRVAKRLILEEL